MEGNGEEVGVSIGLIYGAGATKLRVVKFNVMNFCAYPQEHFYRFRGRCCSRATATMCHYTHDVLPGSFASGRLVNEKCVIVHKTRDIYIRRSGVPLSEIYSSISEPFYPPCTGEAETSDVELGGISTRWG